MSPSLEKINILIVDDTPDNLRLLSTTLTNSGYEVRSAINAKVALMGIDAQMPNIILLDINMPEISGYDLCIQLKQQSHTAGIPIIFISALDDGFDKKKAFAVGGADYITKPFHLEEVLARVRNQLAIQQAQQKLAAQNKQLTEALTTLKQTQTQLIQTEKLSALGKMVAGIAHEINNPVTFIKSNLGFAQDYFHDLLSLLNAYQALYPEAPSSIQSIYQEIDFDYISRDFEKVLASMATGANRIQTIIDALRQFSRLDESGKKFVDIHQCIDSAITILNTQQQALNTIKIQKHYAEIPKIECFPNQLNQAFFNLLENAVESLQNSQSQQAYLVITIKTQYLKRTNWVRIDIQDNGPGISEDLLPKIFDPFVTTKPIGLGPGLGLTISHQILVKQHHGQLECSSTVAQGSTFTIKLPIA